MYGIQWLRISLSKWSTRLGAFLASRRKQSRLPKLCASLKIRRLTKPKKKGLRQCIWRSPKRNDYVSVSVPHPHSDNIRTVHISSSSLITCTNYTTALLVGKHDRLCKFCSLTLTYFFPRSFDSHLQVMFSPWRLCFRHTPNSLIKYCRHSWERNLYVRISDRVEKSVGSVILVRNGNMWNYRSWMLINEAAASWRTGSCA
jgi:hypothetical protein